MTHAYACCDIRNLDAVDIGYWVADRIRRVSRVCDAVAQLRRVEPFL